MAPSCCEAWYVLIALLGNKSSVPTWLRDQRMGKKVPIQMLITQLPPAPRGWLHPHQQLRAIALPHSSQLGTGMELCSKEPSGCLCQCSPCCHSSVPKHLLFVMPTQGAAPAPPALPPATLLAFNCRSYLGPFPLVKTENEITTLLLPALLYRTFQGVSVIKGPRTMILPGLGATLFAQWAVLSLWS